MLTLGGKMTIIFWVVVVIYLWYAVRMWREDRRLKREQNARHEAMEEIE
jgi:heme/copper-type cytochrome/quinol oxidase subunit 2